MSVIRGLLLTLLPVLLAGPLLAADDNYDRILEKFHRGMKSSDLDRRAAAIGLLDPNHEKSLPELKKILTGEHWFLRGTAAEALGRVTDAAMRSELRLELLTNEEHLVREGIALAFALSPEKGDAEALSGALGDEYWEVRRTAAIALAGIVSRDSIAELIGALRKERDPRVSVHIADTLRRISGQNLGRDAAAWMEWWKAAQATAEIEALKEEVKRRKLGGIVLETVTVPTRDRRPGESGPGESLDIFVLPPLGYGHDVYRPYLDELTRFGRVTYVKLPNIRDLTGASGFGDAVPTYPVGKLVKALEELRQELGKNRVLIFASDATGWIAEAYGIKYRQRTAGLVILNGYLDRQSYARAIIGLSKDPRAHPAERWVGETLSGQNDDPHDEETYRRIVRIRLTMSVVEPTDSRAYRLWRDAQDPQGFVGVPDIRFNPRAKMDLPVLFVWGAQSRLSGFPDAERIRYHFPNSICAPLLESRGFPYVSEYDEFYRVLEGYLERFGLL
jgi:pimeloyl-ACP methyl ester carboxylesterase